MLPSDGGTVDASSDWNAPSEVWGNYEEPAPSPPAAQKMAPPEPAKSHLLMEAAVSALPRSHLTIFSSRPKRTIFLDATQVNTLPYVGLRYLALLLLLGRRRR